MIPSEFRLRNKAPDEGDFELLFGGDGCTPKDSSKEESQVVSFCDFGNTTRETLPCGRFIETVHVNGHVFRLLLPPDIGTLFAHRVWSGSVYLSNFLSENRFLVEGKKVVEFGAGTALPSLTSLSLNCRCCIITDYPDEEVLMTLRENVGMNWEICNLGSGDSERLRVAVIGHEWGSDIDDILRFDRTQYDRHTKNKVENIVDSLDDENKAASFVDVALLSECIWMHSEHSNLAKSVHDILCPGGIALLTYAHHIPGKEKEDDAFFTLCEEHYGLKTESIGSKDMEYMWDKNKQIKVHLKILRKC